MDKLPIFLIMIAFAVLVGYVFFIRTRKPLTIEKRVNRIKNRQTLPSGMTLWVEDGASITQPEITAIEAGMQECFERAGHQGYSYPVMLSDYTVAILGNTVHHNGAWCYQIPTPLEYKGSVYDHDGVLWIAGQFLDRPEANFIVIPDHHGQELDELSRVSGYECEHAILRHSDFPKYLATAVHSPATPHPLF